MHEKLQAKLTAIIFIFIIFFFSATGIIIPDQEVSDSERRKLAMFPEININTFTNGTAMKNFSSYMADQFPFRENFLTLKEKLIFSIYRQKDNDNIFIVNGIASELDFFLNEESVGNFIEKINTVCNMYLQNNKIYFMTIPDKNYYIAKTNGYPSVDYEKMTTLLSTKLKENITFINIFNMLSIDDYYASDIHWRSEKLGYIADSACKAMGVNAAPVKDIMALSTPFHGVYALRTSFRLNTDIICYPMDESIENAFVNDIDRGETGGVYWLDNTGRDLYTFYLHGSSSLITIENPIADNENELIIFRDSFGSAFAPWLIEAYKKITLIDIRYIEPTKLRYFVDFKGSDILFMYSTPVINHSETLK